jgi:hypothetical protein
VPDIQVGQMLQKTLAEVLLQSFDLSEILEMNDLTEEEVLSLLIDNGLISEPSRIVDDYEELSLP